MPWVQAHLLSCGGRGGIEEKLLYEYTPPFELIIKPSASILLWQEDFSLNSRARSRTECLYFELPSTFFCVQSFRFSKNQVPFFNPSPEYSTENSRAMSYTECLYFLLFQLFVQFYWHCCKLQNLHTVLNIAKLSPSPSSSWAELVILSA